MSLFSMVIHIANLLLSSNKFVYAQEGSLVSESNLERYITHKMEMKYMLLMIRGQSTFLTLRTQYIY